MSPHRAKFTGKTASQIDSQIGFQTSHRIARPITGGRPASWGTTCSGTLKAALICALAAASYWPSSATALGPNDRRITNARSGITVESPAGWTLSRHTGYATTVVLLLHPDGSRISVSAAAASVSDAKMLYEQNRPALAAQGLNPRVTGTGPRGSIAVDLSNSGRSEKMRQLYLVRGVPSGRQAIVLTLVSGSKMFSTHTSALDFVATRMTLDDPSPTSAETRARSNTAGAGGHSGS